MIKTHSTNFLVLPAHCNYNPLIFGGFLVGEMDKCCAMLANRVLYSSAVAVDAVTVAIDDLSLPRGPVVKDIVFLDATVERIGIKSIKMRVVGYVEIHAQNGKREKTCEAVFTFVSRDKDGNVVPHGLSEEKSPHPTMSMDEMAEEMRRMLKERNEVTKPRQSAFRSTWSEDKTHQLNEYGPGGPGYYDKKF